MTSRRFVACLLLASMLVLTGCAALEPRHVTLTVARDEAESVSNRNARVTTNRIGISATYDLPR